MLTIHDDIGRAANRSMADVRKPSVNRLASLAERLGLGQGTIVVEYYELYDALGREEVDPCLLLEGASTPGHACTTIAEARSRRGSVMICALRSIGPGRPARGPGAGSTLRKIPRRGEMASRLVMGRC